MMSEDENSVQEQPSIKLDYSDEKTPTNKVSKTRINITWFTILPKYTFLTWICFMTENDSKKLSVTIITYLYLFK